MEAGADAPPAAEDDLLPAKFEQQIRREVSRGTFFTKERLEKIAKKYKKSDRKKIVEYVRYLAHLAKVSSKKMRPENYMSTPFPM